MQEFENKIDLIIEAIIEREGGYVNHPDDKGGETKYGITKETAQRYGYTGQMKKLDKAVAKAIYLDTYLMDTGIAKILPLAGPLAVYLLDYAVHSGPNKAIRDLQDSLNVFNNRGRLWSDIGVDGVLGSQTTNALAKAINTRGSAMVDVLLESIDDRRGVLLQNIAKKNQSQEVFLWGWYLRKAEARGSALTLERV